MSSYDNDYTDEMYEHYMLTDEGAEYFLRSIGKKRIQRKS